MEHPDYLYHYTTLDYIPKILDDGFLMLTPSNLVKPSRYWMEIKDGVKTIVSDKDDIKPVVWLTKDGTLDANSHADQRAIGLDSPPYTNLTAKFVIPWNDKYQWWLDWQKKNRMQQSQFRRFTSHGERYSAWYVCEERIPMSDVEEIVNNLTGEVIWRREEVANE